MEKVIYKNEDFVISESDWTCASEVAEFIVRQNYVHHQDGDSASMHLQDEIAEVCLEEKNYDSPRYYLARDNHGELIGCIRVFHWNKRCTLPVESVCHVNPLMQIENSNSYSFWHVGRFAIKGKVEHFYHILV